MRRTSSTRPRAHSQAQALAEFALVVPIFLVLVFGIIEAGRFMFYYEVMNHATREGARYAIVNGSNSLNCPTGPTTGADSCNPSGSDVRDRVVRAAFIVPGAAITFPAIAGCAATPPAPLNPCWQPDNSRGSTVTVLARYTYRPLIPLVPLPDITVQAESTLVVNN
jgi:hypothetical protein